MKKYSVQFSALALRWRKIWHVVKRGLLGSIAVFIGLSPMPSSAQPHSWNGGEVISAPRVVAIYWGTQAPGHQSALDGFYSQIMSSTYLDWLADYSTPQQTIGRGTFGGSFAILPSDARSVDTISIAREIDGQILAGAIPFPTADTIYMVHFGPAMTPTMGTSILGYTIGANVGTGFCAYHYTARVQVPIVPPFWFGYGPKLRIAVIPTVSTIPICNPLNTLDDATHLASHELVETITDPDSVVLGMFPIAGETLECNGFSLPPGAALLNAMWGWISASSSFCNPNEIADDLLIGRFRTSPAVGDSFLVARPWRNSAGTNILSGPAGTLDGANAGNDGLVRGWALDQDTTGSINVTITIDGTNFFAVPANFPRPDVNAATGINGAFGFQFAIPPGFLDGRSHSIDVFARGATPGNDTRLSSIGQSFSSPQIPPPGPTPTQICIADCAAEQDVCMQDAHSGPERGACVRQYNACRRSC